MRRVFNYGGFGGVRKNGQLTIFPKAARELGGGGEGVKLWRDARAKRAWRGQHVPLSTSASTNYPLSKVADPSSGSLPCRLVPPKQARRSPCS
jgi:hypothetical protein